MIELSGDNKEDSAMLLPYKLRQVYFGCDFEQVGEIVNNELTLKASLNGRDLFSFLWKWQEESESWNCESCESLISPFEVTDLVKSDDPGKKFRTHQF